MALFMAAVLALNLTPGPDMLFCFANGVSQGRVVGAVAALGIGAGTLVHTAAAALGLAGLLLASPLAFDIVRYAGAAYLVWLAWKTLRAAPLGASGAALAPRSLWRVFAQGAVTNVLNPKVALFFLAFLPQFVDPNAGPVALQVFVLGMLINLSGHWSIWRWERGLAAWVPCWCGIRLSPAFSSMSQLPSSLVWPPGLPWDQGVLPYWHCR